MENIILATKLTKIYGEKETSVKALDNVDVQFNENEFTAIMGPSGSGKSTLLHCLAGLDRPTSGQIFLKDQDISTLNDKQLTKIRRDSFGFVFQAFNLREFFPCHLLPTPLALKSLRTFQNPSEPDQKLENGRRNSSDR